MTTVAMVSSSDSGRNSSSTITYYHNHEIVNE